MHKITQTFDEWLLKKPHDIRAVFISDLHLSCDTILLNQAFISLLDKLIHLEHLKYLYILGDWLDGWIGDDDYLNLTNTQKQLHWLTPIVYKLTQLSQKSQIIIMHGNRDFAIRQRFCDVFNAKLVSQPYYIRDAFIDTIRLEHGDLLCTDDISYQRYRKVIQNPLISFILLHLPLSFRRKLARNIKKQSYNQKTKKPNSITDVNQKAVLSALTTCDTLIHGHTHRPACHNFKNKRRLVLGDWRLINKGNNQQNVSAVIGVQSISDLQLLKFYHSS